MIYNQIVTWTAFAILAMFSFNHIFFLAGPAPVLWLTHLANCWHRINLAAARLYFGRRRHCVTGSSSNEAAQYQFEAIFKQRDRPTLFFSSDTSFFSNSSKLPHAVTSSKPSFLALPLWFRRKKKQLHMYLNFFVEILQKEWCRNKCSLWVASGLANRVSIENVACVCA